MILILGPAVDVVALTLTASTTVFRGDSPREVVKNSRSSSSSGSVLCSKCGGVNVGDPKEVGDGTTSNVFE